MYLRIDTHTRGELNDACTASLLFPKETRMKSYKRILSR